MRWLDGQGEVHYFHRDRRTSFVFLSCVHSGQHGMGLAWIFKLSRTCAAKLQELGHFGLLPTCAVFLEKLGLFGKHNTRIFVIGHGWQSACLAFTACISTVKMSADSDEISSPRKQEKLIISLLTSSTVTQTTRPVESIANNCNEPLHLSTSTVKMSTGDDDCTGTTTSTSTTSACEKIVSENRATPGSPLYVGDNQKDPIAQHFAGSESEFPDAGMSQCPPGVFDDSCFPTTSNNFNSHPHGLVSSAGCCSVFFCFCFVLTE